MTITTRSYLTAGVAALGVGAIALTPVQPLPNNLAMAPERVVSNLSVELASIIDPWVDAFGTAVENGQRLNAAWNANTFPIFQTILTNQLVYAQEFPKIGVIAKQIFANLLAAPAALFVADPENISKTVTVIPTFMGQPIELGLSQYDIYAVLQSPLSPLPPEIKPLLEFMTTPFSGAALAVIGPVIGPVLSMADSLKATFAALKARNLPAAFNEFMALAPNAVNAFLNGGKILDLTNLVNRIAPLPPEVSSIGLNMGGLVSSGLTPVEGEVSKGVSGTMFDGVAAEASVDIGIKLDVDDPGLSVGPIGATQLLTKRVAEAIKVTLPQTAATVAPAAAEGASSAALDAAAPAEEAAPVADAAPAPKRKARAASRGDNGNGPAGRSHRAARNAG